MAIKQEELEEIKTHPAGRALWHYLRQQVQSLTEQWQAGQFNSEDPNVCTVANVSAVTKIKLLKELIEIDADELNEEAQGDREQIGISTSRARGVTESL